MRLAKYTAHGVWLQWPDKPCPIEGWDWPVWWAYVRRKWYWAFMNVWLRVRYFRRINR